MILEQRYQDKRLQKCCHSGLMQIPMLLTCEERAERVRLRNPQDCVDAFLDCCHEGKRLRDLKRKEDLQKGLGRSMGSWTDSNAQSKLLDYSLHECTFPLASWSHRVKDSQPKLHKCQEYTKSKSKGTLLSSILEIHFFETKWNFSV